VTSENYFHYKTRTVAPKESEVGRKCLCVKREAVLPKRA